MLGRGERKEGKIALDVRYFFGEGKKKKNKKKEKRHKLSPTRKGFHTKEKGKPAFGSKGGGDDEPFPAMGVVLRKHPHLPVTGERRRTTRTKALTGPARERVADSWGESVRDGFTMIT